MRERAVEHDEARPTHGPPSAPDRFRRIDDAFSRDRHGEGRGSGRLDFGWWASNAPTGGYLTRLSLEEAGRVMGEDVSTVRSVDLHVLRSAAADDFETTVEVAAGPAGRAVVTVTFRQARPFAIASVYFSPSAGSAWAYLADADPPAALAPLAYAEMTMGGVAGPPVASQFRYRPTTGLDGAGPRPGWDVFWVQPARRHAAGRAGVVGMIDCWYPPSYMRSVREYLRDPREALIEPRATNLMGVQVLFSAPDSSYQNTNFALVANSMSAGTDGHYFEHSEIWSEQGELLITAQLLRRNQPTGGNRTAPGFS
jgi:Thioesterase-like superfamily